MSVVIQQIPNQSNRRSYVRWHFPISVPWIHFQWFPLDSMTILKNELFHCYFFRVLCPFHFKCKFLNKNNFFLSKHFFKQEVFLALNFSPKMFSSQIWTDCKNFPFMARSQKDDLTWLMQKCQQMNGWDFGRVHVT